MKKLVSKLTFCILLLAPLFTFSSCEDESIASNLQGFWRGEVAQRFFSYRYGHVTEYREIEIEFYSNPFSFKSGKGVEYDYSSSYRYTECFFRFNVDGGVIYIDYEDGSHIAIRDFYLRNGRFSGVFHDRDTNERLATFSLEKVVHPRMLQPGWKSITPEEAIVK